MSKIGWIIFSAVAILLLGGLIVWARVTNPPVDVSTIDNNSIIAASDQNGQIADHVKGSTEGKIIFIEYGDFQCPSCAGAGPNFSALTEEYGNDVTFIFRNFPLTSIHPNALAAAASAEAAGLQGKFWEMHDLLFDNQSDWNTANTTQRTTIFTGYAESLDLDMDRFSEDLASKTVTTKINFDMAMGRTNGVQATPTFFLNGEQLDGEIANGIVQGNLDPIRERLDALVAESQNN